MLSSTVTAAACQFASVVPPGAQLSCVNDGECPDGMVCVALARRCVHSDASDSTPPGAVDVVLSPERLGGADTLEVSFGVTEELVAAPLIDVGTVAVTATAVDARRYHASVAAADVAEGFVPVTVALVDLHANVAVAVLGVVEVDRTAPAVVVGSVAWTVHAPPGSAPVVPTTLTVGSRGALAFELDDPRGHALEVTARADNGAELAFTPDGTLDDAWAFAVVLGAAAPGEYRVLAAVADDLGNGVEVEVPLPAPGFVVGTVQGATCLARHDDGSAACTDLDADGYAGAADGCATGTDCDDTRGTVHPGGLEVPGNGVDDDCDGYEPPLDATAGVFVAPHGRAGAAGTPDDPLADLVEAAGHARPIFLQRGTYALGAAPLASSLHGGLDASWLPTAEPSTLVSPGHETALSIDAGLVPLRVEGVHVSGPSCAVLAVRGAPVEVSRVVLETAGDACTPGAFPAALWFDGGSLHASDVTIDASYGDSAAAGANGIAGLGDLVLVDSAVAMRGGTRAVLGGHERSTVVVRSHVSSSIDIDAPIFGVESPGALTVVASDVHLWGSLGTMDAILGADLVVVHTSVRVDVIANAGHCFGGAGPVTALSSRCAISTPGRAVFGATLRVIGNAFDERSAGCLALDATLGCLDLQTLERCDFAGCVEARANVVAAADVPVAGTATLDLGAPSTVAMDFDGECRGATDVEAGADELP